jgi:hypothetical protein
MKATIAVVMGNVRLNIAVLTYVRADLRPIVADDFSKNQGETLGLSIERLNFSFV